MNKTFFVSLTLVFFTLAFWAGLGYSEQSPVIRRLSFLIEDVLFKARYASEPLPESRSKILIIAVDDESSFRLGLRWPWPRTIFASMVDELSKKGAAVIALNFTFTGLEDGREDSTKPLADAIARHGRVVVGSTLEGGRLIKPNEILTSAGVRSGYLEKIVDDDFVIRRTHPAQPLRSGGSLEPSFPLAVWELGRPGSVPSEKDPDKPRPINYLVKTSDVRTISAWKLLERRVGKEAIQGKTVFIGITSSLLSEEHRTPLGLMSGVAVHGNEWVALEEGRPIREASRPFSVFTAWLVGAVLLFLFLHQRVWSTALGFSVSFFLAFFFSQALFGRDLQLPLFTLLSGPALALGVGFAANLAWLLLENRGLSHRVLHDKMTGLYTYDYLRMRLDDEWKRCRKLQLPVSVVMTDLDRFKKINDTLGHETGNKMILRAAGVIRESVRGYDVVSRYGGDEFAILLWHSNRDEAMAYRERLRALYEKMARGLEDPMLKESSISIGLASYDPKEGTDQAANPQQLIERADKDLFEDKQARRKPGESGR